MKDNKTQIKTVDQIVDGLTLMDDDLMSRVFDNNIAATELLLKIILGRDDLKVTNVVGQREYKSPDVGGRNIRLDIDAEDTNDKKYDIEVQRSVEGADIHRARYNSSMLDTHMLKEGQKFTELRETYVIFITEKDVWKGGCPIYNIERTITQTGEVVDDGSHIIYVNGTYKGDDPLGKLLHDFRCEKSEDIYYNEFKEGVHHFKETEGGRKIMCQAVEEYGRQTAEETRLSTQLDAIKGIMETFKTTFEQAASVAKISEADKAKLIKMI